MQLQRSLGRHSRDSSYLCWICYCRCIAGIPIVQGNCKHLCLHVILLQSTVTSVLKGCGRQFLSAVVNFCCYYVIGVPIGAVLALVFKMGALGLCIGLTCANTLQVC